MPELMQFLLELVRDKQFKTSGLSESTLHHMELVIIVIGLFSGAIVGGFLFYLNWRQFRKRAFFDQMVIGINTLEAGPQGRWVLKLRTLVESNLRALLDDPVLVRLVRNAAKKCTLGDPILKLKNTGDHALLLTKIQNAVSSPFAREHVLRMLGEHFRYEWVEFVVTCEKYGGLKATKIRVLLFKEEDMERIIDPSFYKTIVVDEEHHLDRLRTLRHIATKKISEKSILCGRVEIPLPLRVNN